MRPHVKLRLADLQPDGTLITEGRICERAAMRRMLKPGEFHLGDRNYGADHGLFAEFVEMGCGFVLRLRNETTWEVEIFFRWHQMGWADDEELARFLAAEEAARQRRTAAKKKD